MIYYVIKKVSDVTVAQLNVTEIRKIDNLRKNKNGKKCIMEFDESGRAHFMDDQWLTLDEVRILMSDDEWQPHEPSAPGIMSKVAEFFGVS